MISEVFGGGNSGGPFNRDFIELFNRGDVPVDLSGWSVQYAAPGSGVWLVTPLAGTVAPGQYFLIGGAGGGPGAPLPPPDVVGSIDLSAFGGKVALVRNPVPLTDPDPDLFAVIDLVGYGPADFFEGPGPAPPLAPAISDQRLNGGFVDTNNNAVDFVPGTPTPQNSDAFHPSHVNLPPTIEAPAYQITPQDTAVVFSNVNFNPIFIDDVDAANRPVQVSLSVTSGLLSVGGTEDASITFIGTLDAINIALDGLRFTPAVGFTGNVPLTITADDLGNSGSGGPRVVQAQVPISVGRAVLVQAIDAAAFEEGQDPARFTLTRTGDTSTPLTVSYTVGGTATFGSGPGGDYTLSLSGSPLPSSGSITIPAGLSEVTIDVLPIDDVVLENEETVQFTVLNGATYVVAANGQAEGKINDKSFGLDKTKKAEANNHEAAHALATGAGIKVGVVDTSLKDVKGIVEKKAHLGSRLKLNQDLTGLKPLEVVDAMNPNPEGRAIPQDKANHEHSTLVADVIASGDDRFTGVAKGAEVYAAFVDGVDSTRLAIDYLYGRQQVALFNLSFVDISSPGLESFVDWFTITRDVLFVSAAGNRSFSEYITSPAIAFDGITVGAVGADFKTRGPYSNWRTSLEADGTDPSTSKDVRGLPHVLAPGGEQGKHITNGTISLRGTSFAAPHVTGIAALLAQRQARNMDLPLGTAGQSNHLAYKAIILNSARKRYINAPKNDHPNALDNDATKDQPSDFNYLKVVDGKPALNDVADPAKTADWTPANWSLANIDGRTYKKLVVTSPLDDEQGTGVADAERALIQYNGGTGTENSGKKAPGNVGRIGWNIDKLRLGEGGAAATHEYNLNFAVQKGAMITVTLAWDRLLDETESNGLAGDGRVELKDVYNSPNDGPRGSKGMTDFNLKILHNGVPVAESVAPVGNQDKGDVVEHLHFPAPEDGNAGAYKIVVELKQHGAGANKDYTYALAWWA